MRVDRIPLVMSMPIRHMGDKGFGLAKLRENPFNDIEVVPLVVAAEVINLTDSPLLNDGQDAPAVVLDVEPVPDVEALAING